MSLVLYSDSEPDDDDKNEPLAALALRSEHSRLSSKRKRSEPDHQVNPELPPLPAAFHDLYSTNARTSTSDDPSLHGGRKRAVPHVEGNWPSHVYLEWVPSQTEAQNLRGLIEHVRESIERANKCRRKLLPVPDITPSLRSPLGTPLPLHVSLSRTLQIRTQDKGSFFETLIASLRKAAVRPFHIRFTTMKWVPNFERNRWFLVLGIERPAQDELNRLLGACNEASKKCGFPGLYVGGRGDGPMDGNTSIHQAKSRKRDQIVQEKKDDCTESEDRTENFHISIAWNLLEPDPEWITLVRNIDVSKHVSAPEAPFDMVKAKIGNVVNNIDLGSRKSGRRKGGVLGLE